MDKGIQGSVLDLIFRDREGEPVDTNLIQTIVQIFCDVGMKQVSTGQRKLMATAENKPREEITLDVYIEEFEVDFLKDTSEYYQRKSQKWVEEDSFPDYMRKAEELYNREKQRCATYLHETTEPKLLRLIDNELIGVHQMLLLKNESSGLNKLLSSYVACGGTDDKDLARMYSLFVRLPDSDKSGITPITEMFREFVTEVGLEVVQMSQGDESKKLVERHVEKYHLFNRLVEGAFKADHRFQLAMKEAFEKIVNQDVIVKPATETKSASMMQTAELMADYIDAVLKGKMHYTTEETWTCMDNVVSLFAHLQEKDVFQTFHSELLAKRLVLYSDKVNMDYEGNFISKLKTLAGAYFTRKMEKMMMDLNGVADAEAAYEEHCGGRVECNGHDIKMETQVLTRTNWPNYSSFDLKCPPQIQACMDSYNNFYLRKHERRVLKWIHTMGTAQINLDFVPGKVQPTVTVSVIQAAFMMLFNERAEITCGDVAKMLGVTEKFIKKYINSLALPDKKHPQYQLLKATRPDGTPVKSKKTSLEFVSEDILTLNAEGLGDKKLKLKRKYDMPLREMKVDGAEQAAILAKLQQERVWNIDAQIVREMKTRQRMKEGALVMAVVDGLKHLFNVQAPFVKGRILVLAEGNQYDEGQILKPIGDDEYEYVA